MQLSALVQSADSETKYDSLDDTDISHQHSLESTDPIQSSGSTCLSMLKTKEEEELQNKQVETKNKFRREGNSTTANPVARKKRTHEVKPKKRKLPQNADQNFHRVSGKIPKYINIYKIQSIAVNYSLNEIFSAV